MVVSIGMPQIRLMSENDKVQWDRVVTESQEGMIYHSTKWLDAIQESNPRKFHPLHLVLEDESGDFLAVFPLFLDNRFLMSDAKSIPYCSFGGPCFLPGRFESEGLHQFLHRINSLARDLGISKVKIYSSPFEDKLRMDSQYASYGFEIREDFTEFILPLGGSTQVVWKKLGKNIRRTIRIAMKRGVEVAFAEDTEELTRFYALYSDFCHRKRIGEKPFSFFQSIWKNLFPEHLQLILANYEDVLISGLAILADKGVVHYWCPCSKLEYRHLNSNDLMIWETIKWAIDNGYRMLDLGCSNKALRGIYRFKEKWGSEKIVLHRRFKEYHSHSFLSRTKHVIHDFLLESKESFSDYTE